MQEGEGSAYLYMYYVHMYMYEVPGNPLPLCDCARYYVQVRGTTMYARHSAAGTVQYCTGTSMHSHGVPAGGSCESMESGMHVYMCVLQ